MLINTLIVDDEQLARQRIRKLLAERTEFSISAECKTGKEAIVAIQEERPQLMFLDIQMKDMDGFEVLEHIAPEQMPLIIFVTAYDQFAIKAFDHFAFDYLLKPFKDERFYRSLGKAQKTILEQAQRQPDGDIKALMQYLTRFPKDTPVAPEKQLIPLKTGGKVSFIEMDSIQYIVASGYYIEIYARDRKHLLRESMSSMIEKLNTRNFIRIHRSTIINTLFLQSINSVGYGDVEVEMKDGKCFRVSKSYKEPLFGRLGL